MKDENINSEEFLKQIEGMVFKNSNNIECMESLLKKILDQIKVFNLRLENYERQLNLIKGILRPVDGGFNAKQGKEVLSRFHEMSLRNKKTGTLMNIALHDGKEWVWVAPQLDRSIDIFINDLLNYDIESLELIYK